MEQNAIRGIERATGSYRKQMIKLQSISILCTISLFTAAAYFKSIRNFQNNVICLVTALLLDNFLVYGYNAYILHTHGRKLIRIVSNVSRLNQPSDSGHAHRGSTHSQRYKAVYQKFKTIVPAIEWLMISSAVSTFGLSAWALITMNSDEGMAKSCIVHSLNNFVSIDVK